MLHGLQLMMLQISQFLGKWAGFKKEICSSMAALYIKSSVLELYVSVSESYLWGYSKSEISYEYGLNSEWFATMDVVMMYVNKQAQTGSNTSLLSSIKCN